MAVFWVERISYADRSTAGEHRFYIQTDVCDPRVRDAVTRAYAARVTAARSAATDEEFGAGSGGAVWCYLGRAAISNVPATVDEEALEQARTWLADHAGLVDGDTLRTTATTYRTPGLSARRGMRLLRYFGRCREWA